MAISSSGDIQARLLSLIPPGWFSNKAPLRDAVLGGIADVLYNAYLLLVFVKTQTRMATASGIWLDLIANDFFGTALLRRPGQTDAALLGRVQAEVLRERVTRNGMMGAITALTGTTPMIIEPFNTGDCGSIGFTFAVGVGYPVGSLQYPNQALIQVPRPRNAGIPNVAGIGSYGGGIGVGALTPITLNQETGITDADIYAVITHTKPTGSIMWTQLQ